MVVKQSKHTALSEKGDLIEYANLFIFSGSGEGNAEVTLLTLTNFTASEGPRCLDIAFFPPLFLPVSSVTTTHYVPA